MELNAMEASAMAVPAPEQISLVSAGLVCGLCGVRAVVHWQRRLTSAEFAAHLALEEQRRDERLRLADPEQPVPGFGPLPRTAECTTPVYACAVHAIGLDAAALIHQSTCTAPNPVHLPGCDCTPEPAPPVDPESTRVVLPDHWTGGS
ncbi:hypothetical protein FHS39_002580 [Streptomyces olivoverticillatus]|uniref:Uncharacterized protein n=1 Tax=Streptomyces olivoverticillatus TaxID=66427 RepID=A0A7W7LNV5_9ACTN|nr:hypothetical protein [Streptomyces olivoverticillatus]MBB4893549.1 hypothetical protein [Streptomyces olivoverticillatus]